MPKDALPRPIGVLRSRIPALHRGGRAVVTLLLTAALAAFAPLACNDGGSITAPALPPPPPPLNMVVVGAAYRLLITPFNEERTFPRSAELLVDGHSIWAGDVRPPYIYDSFYYGPYEIPAGVAAQVESALSVGTHTLSFRVTDQQRSPTGYYLSGGVDVYWQGYSGDNPVGGRDVQNVLHWQDTQARLRTGQEWTIEFVVPDRSQP